MRIICAITFIFASLLANAEAPPHAAFGPEYLGPNDVIRVDIDTECNIFAVTQWEYENYCKGLSFNYYGKWAKSSPVYLTPPMGSYIVVIDNAGRGIRGIRAGVRVVRSF